MPEGCNRKYVTGAHVQGEGAEKVNEGLTPAELFKVWAATGMPITLPPETVKAVAAYVEQAAGHRDDARAILDRAERCLKWGLFAAGCAVILAGLLLPSLIAGALS